jgi:hypothetical protein
MATAAPITAKTRRTVRYASLSALWEDAEKLAAGNYETVGQWTFGQILDHLATTLNSSIDGFPFRPPPHMRMMAAIMTPFFKQSFLTQPMKAGYKLPKYAGPMFPPPGLSAADGLARIRAAVERFERETPEARHPFLGRLTPDEWISLHLRHAELHMSFVRPA